MAGDTPFFPRDLVPRLRQSGDGIVLAASRDGQGRNRDHPIFGLWPTALRDALRGYLARGERRVRGFAMIHGAARAVWDAEPVDPFFNINTPGDLDRARSALRLQP